MKTGRQDDSKQTNIQKFSNISNEQRERLVETMPRD